MFHLKEKRQFSICVSVWSLRYENGSRDLAAFEEDLMIIIPNNITFKISIFAVFAMTKLRLEVEHAIVIF